MIPARDYSDYFFENLGVDRTPAQLQITSSCNAKCLFCSNDQNPFQVHRTSFRPLSEIKKMFWAFPSDYYGDIALNESLPGRLSEGEALIHPQIFDILEFIRGIRPENLIRITTNGSLLSTEMIEKLAQFKPLSISISFHSTVKEHWCKVFHLDEVKYNNAIQSFQKLKDAGIDVGASMVPMPSLVGYDDIEKTVAFLSQYVNYIQIWGPGYTNYTKPETLAMLKYDKDELSKFLAEMSKKYSVSLHWSLDPTRLEELEFPKDVFYSQFVRAFKEKKELLFLSSTAAYKSANKVFPRIARDFPGVSYEIREVPNKAYGGNIQVSGLWMLSDVESALGEYNIKSKTGMLVCMPGNFLDYYGHDLQGNHVMTFLEKYSENASFTIQRSRWQP